MRAFAELSRARRPRPRRGATLLTIVFLLTFMYDKDMEVGARITSKGQVTIPAAVRRALHLNKGDEVIFEVAPGPGTPHAQVRKAADFMALAGSVPVPAEWAGADWPSLRAAAWLAQAQRHDNSHQ